MITKYVPPMTYEEYMQLPQIVRCFVSWEDARQGKVVVMPDKKQLDDAVKYFTEAEPLLSDRPN